MHRYATAWVVTALAWTTACGSSPPPLLELPPTVALAPLHPQEPYVAARAEFTIVLDSPIGTQASTPGQRFSAHVEHPVRSPENEIVVQTHALVHGEVVSIERGPAPIVRIRFLDIDTVFGPTPLVAVVRDAERYAWLPRNVSYDRKDGYDATLYSPTRHPADDPSYVDMAAVGGGPREPTADDQVLIPVGARLRLSVTEPIAPRTPRAPR